MTDEPSEPSGQQLTWSVAKALNILESFTERAPSLCLAELVKLPPTTLRRLLGTLESLGCVRQESSGSHLLDMRALSLTPPALAGLEMRCQALPILDELSPRTCLNANLGILAVTAGTWADCGSQMVSGGIR
jgi:DNA-binding IclR family transcriptional regulator